MEQMRKFEFGLYIRLYCEITIIFLGAITILWLYRTIFRRNIVRIRVKVIYNLVFHSSAKIKYTVCVHVCVYILKEKRA